MIYDIAGLRILIQNRCKYTEMFCKAYLSDDQTSPYDISATVTNEEFYEEKKASSQFSDGYIENICLYRAICRQMPVLNRMLLHAAVLEYEGNGYAFLGRSGTGKSTHTGLWLKHLEGSKIVNGDKPILQSTEQGFIAYGTPWMGKEGLGCNSSAPLKGLCFLEQAKENSITRLTPAEAASRIFVQILFPEDEKNAARTLELTDKLVTETPAYLLKCNISKEAVKTSFEAMTGKPYSPKN
ncbi:MAG: hypothetical protein IJB34_05375 [Clostridia bacterium]|nr:hypothetical protein [Clostridia bacterium]